MEPFAFHVSGLSPTFQESIKLALAPSSSRPLEGPPALSLQPVQLLIDKLARVASGSKHHNVVLTADHFFIHLLVASGAL